MKISEALRITEVDLAKFGVFDAFLGVDSRLHIDPSLLRTIKIPEFQQSLSHFEDYFNKVLRLVVNASPGSALERQAIRSLIFPEIPVAALGFSAASTSGRGVTRTVAERLYKTAKELAVVGILDPSIFEIAVVFEEKFGPDLISDMTLVVLLDDFSAYNKRICQKLGIPTIEIPVRKTSFVFTAAFSERCNRPIFLIPKALLSELPVATCRDDIDHVVFYNATMRAKVNQMLGASWQNLAGKLRKSELRSLLLGNPEGLREILKRYKEQRPEPYDFERDPLGEVLWEPLGREAAAAHPIVLKPALNQEDLAAIVRTIAEQFKQLIEYNGAHEFLFDDNGRRRHEKFSQLFFYAVADSYCTANNLDISREPNAGRGPVDFKLSQGGARTLVELKLSSNSSALGGLLRQLPEYGKAERTESQLYLLIIVGNNVEKVERIEAEHSRLKSLGTRIPDLVIVDAFGGYNAPSASNL
jgi:hypothetical protein